MNRRPALAGSRNSAAVGSAKLNASSPRAQPFRQPPHPRLVRLVVAQENVELKFRAHVFATPARRFRIGTRNAGLQARHVKAWGGARSAQPQVTDHRQSIPAL